MATSPYINRFLQPDTIVPDLSNPQSWNRYSYVYNNPILLNDPTGHFAAAALALPLINPISFAAISAALAPVLPVLIVAVAVVAVVAIGVIVYDKYIDKTAIDKAQTVDKNHNDLINGKKFPKGPCRGVRGKVYCGAIIGMGAAAVTNMLLGDGSIGEDESPAKPITPLPTYSPTLTSTPTHTPVPTPVCPPYNLCPNTPTSTQTFTPSSTPTTTPSSTPSSTPSFTPTPNILPKPSNQFPAIPI